MKYQIITDSCCDFTDAEYKSMDVACVPLSVIWEGSAHTHFSSESALRSFYGRMREGLHKNAGEKICGALLPGE